MERASVAPDSESEAELRQELRAALATYWELGPDYEQQVVDSFVERTRPVFRQTRARAVQRYSARRSHGGGRRGVLLAVVAAVAWAAIAGPIFGHAHEWHAYPRYYQPPVIEMPDPHAPVLMPAIVPSAGPILVQEPAGAVPVAPAAAPVSVPVPAP